MQQAYSVKMLKREDYTYPVPISMTGMTLNISFSVIREDTWSLPKLIEVNLSVPEVGLCTVTGQVVRIFTGLRIFSDCLRTYQLCFRI